MGCNRKLQECNCKGTGDLPLGGFFCRAFEERHTNEGGPRGQNRDILVGFLNWVGAFLAPGPSRSPLVRQVRKHPAFSVSPVVPLSGQIQADFSHFLDNLLGPFSGIFRQCLAISGNFWFFWRVARTQTPHTHTHTKHTERGGRHPENQTTVQSSEKIPID